MTIAELIADLHAALEASGLEQDLRTIMGDSTALTVQLALRQNTTACYFTITRGGQSESYTRTIPYVAPNAPSPEQ